MKSTLLICVLVLSGCCTNTNIKPAFPEPPANAETCEPLMLVPTTEKLSEVISVVATNYGKYHTCTASVEKWQEWYTSQKEIYNNLK